MKFQLLKQCLLFVLILLSHNLSASLEDSYVLTDDDVVMEGNVLTESTIKGVKTRIVIPDTLDGFAVEEIRGIPFYSCSLTEVYLPKTLKIIGISCFKNNKLTSITIPKSVLKIGSAAFSYNDLNTIVIEENSQLKTIETYAFSNNSIGAVILPESLVFFGADVFSNNPIQEIILPKSAYEWVDEQGNSYRGGEPIDDYKKEYILKSEYTLRDDDVIIESGIMTQCNYDFSSTCITIPNILDGQTIKGIGKEVFKDENVLSVVLPDSLEMIDSAAFWNTKIQELQLPNALRKIEYGVFTNCNIKILNIKNGSNIEYIGAYAFSGNRIMAINMPSKLYYIGQRAFANNTLTSINIPSSLRYLGAAAFNGNNINTLNGEEFDGVFYALDSVGNQDKRKIVSFARTDVTTLNLLEGVEIVGKQAFDGSSSLLSVDFPSSLKRIEEMGFRSTGLVSLDFSSTQLVFLGEQAFNLNTSLNTINFEGCEMLDTISTRCFNFSRSVKSVNLNPCKELKYIGELAFAGMGRLESFTLDSCKSLQFVGVDALRSSRKLSGIILPILDSLIWMVGNDYILDSEEVSDYSQGFITKKRDSHSVKFLDWDGGILLEDSVLTGKSTAVPAGPSREGYQFKGWGETSLVVFKDTVITAQYQINSYAVKFLDWDKKLIVADSVIYMEGAKAPNNPTRKGYTFVGWDKGFSEVKSDLEVNALYEINSYRISFMSWNDTILSIDSVQYGSAASAPSAPTRENYYFSGWDKSFASVSGDMVINALYELVSYAVTFSDWDNRILLVDSVQYGGAATAPDSPSRDGYAFTGWSVTFDEITSDLNVVAEYTESAAIAENSFGSFRIYPNPAKTIVTIETTRGEVVKLYNILGELLVSRQALSIKTVIDVRGLSSGTYIIAKGSTINKLIVE